MHIKLIRLLKDSTSTILYDSNVRHYGRCVRVDKEDNRKIDKALIAIDKELSKKKIFKKRTKPKKRYERNVCQKSLPRGLKSRQQRL